MRTASTLLAAGSTMLLAACVTLPSGPSLQALPGSRRSYEQFVLDDGQCRSIATAQIGGRTPTDAANQSAAASAAVGTAVGAASGALIDGSSGAAAGAGIGLMFGALAGTAAAQDSYAITQQQFDTAYYSCMYARGHKVPVPASAVARYRSAYESVAPHRAPALPPPPDLPPPDYRPPPGTPPR